MSFFCVTEIALQPPHEFKLGKWHVRPLRGVIQSEERTERITPKAMDVLLCMAQRPGDVVDRATFIDEVWDGRAFSDDPLNKCIAELRRQLGDRAGTRQYIETIPKRGYRLVAAVESIGEVAPDPPKARVQRSIRIIALGILLVLAAIGAWQLSQHVVPDVDIAIAVLPFSSLDDSGKQYFADGIHEELIGELSRGRSLVVRSRTSTLQYRDRNRPLPEIAAALDADVIVEGSVRQDGDSVRVSAQVIRADVDESLWAGSIEKSMSVADIFAIQSAIALEIAQALQVTLNPDEQPAEVALPTDNIAAYDAFMLGKFHYRRKLPGDIRESVQQFERAVTLDPGFAQAWDWLAYAYNHAATGVGYLSADEAYPKARAAALRALELNPDLATALSILGYIRGVYDRDWLGAVTDLERALQLDPHDSGTVWSLAHIYSMLGRHDQAIELTRQFAAEFPEDGRNHAEVAARLLDAGRYDEVLQQLEIAAGHEADPASLADTRGIALLALDRPGDAIAELEYAVDAKQRAAGTVGRLAYAYGMVGKRDRAAALRTELEQRKARERVPRLALATAALGTGDADAAIAELRLLVDDGGREPLILLNDPLMTPLHDEPAFQALMHRIAPNPR